ncbi:CHRD domain-containing protein [Aquisphaera giovannonii]|uniref:CHRD domain-containing protein n=1 Tax=Aquisphaera giovannonii TaxID=406548 RepID=UPI0036F23E13
MPPNATAGTGFARVELDTVGHTLHVEVTFSGLLGATTAAHIHAATDEPSPARPGSRPRRRPSRVSCWASRAGPTMSCSTRSRPRPGTPPMSRVMAAPRSARRRRWRRHWRPARPT